MLDQYEKNMITSPVMKPVLRKTKAPRVRIQIVELQPDGSGRLQRGQNINLTVYDVNLKTAAKIIENAFSKSGES